MTAMIKGSDVAGDSAYDVERIRTDFPILFREIYGKPLVYLDNGASAQKPRAVLDAIEHAYKMEYANVHRGLHYLSNTATSKYEDARETVRRFLNAPSTDEIIFTRNATAGIDSSKVKFISFDTIDPALDLLREGKVEVLLGQKYFGWGSEPVKLLYNIKQGKMPPSPIIDSGVDIVTRENVDEYAEQWKKMVAGGE